MKILFNTNYVRRIVCDDRSLSQKVFVEYELEIEETHKTSYWKIMVECKSELEHIQRLLKGSSQITF